MDELNSRRSKSCCRASREPLKIDAGPSGKWSEIAHPAVDPELATNGVAPPRLLATGTLTALALGASRMILFVM